MKNGKKSDKWSQVFPEQRFFS